MSSLKRPRRKAAAAEVFRQQNVMNVGGRMSEEEQDFDDDLESALDEVFEVEAKERRLGRRAFGGNAPMGSDQPQAQAAQAPSPAPLPEPQNTRRIACPLYREKRPKNCNWKKTLFQVRETGFLFWKRIIVPPNAYVVHTRAGRDQPVTLGLGLSFRYNPQTDAYLVVPAAMQTIGVVSNCISKEKQGINVLAYVQWQISDFSIAYRKLDFSDTVDPLGIVNAQLREQADAAIKDKIATMSVEEVLTDKAPIIEELTRRLIEVSEGRVRGEKDNEADGLGIKIVTVQIKEAFVSSRNLWENLQAPYRHDQQRNARISYLDMQEEIRTKQLETRQATETSEAETQVRIERVREEKKTEALELRLEEDEKRKQREQESRTSQLQREQELKLTQERTNAETQSQLADLKREQQIQAMQAERELAEQQAQIEQQRLLHEAELKRAQFTHEQLVQEQDNLLKVAALEADLNRNRQQQQAQVEIETLLQEARHRQAQQAAEIARLQQEIRNLVNEQALLKDWIAVLPQLADSLPDVQEMRVLQMGESENHLASFLAQQGALFSTLRQFLQNGQSENGSVEEE